MEVPKHWHHAAGHGISEQQIKYARMITADICRIYSIQVHMILGTLRWRPLPYIRQDLMYRLYTVAGLSHPQIGFLFNRHHTTVMHSVTRGEYRSAIKQVFYAALDGRLEFDLRHDDALVCRADRRKRGGYDIDRHIGLLATPERLTYL